MNDVTWIGSNHLLNTAGYYESYHSRTPRAAWPYDDTRDAGLAEVPNGGGYPTCQQWWADRDVGLRARLLGQVNPDLMQRFGRWAGFLSQTEVDDAVIRAIASPQHQTVNQGQVYTDYGGQIDMTLPNIATRVVSDIGLMIGTMAFVPAMDVVRRAVPMVLSLTKMALVICIPLLLIIGTYELKVVATVSCVMFAVFFVEFWFELARWMDSTIMDALYGWTTPHSNLNALLGLNNTFGDMILNWFVMGTMFLIFPALWVTALAWTGVQVGNVLQGLSQGTRAAGEAGGKGFGAVVNVAAATAPSKGKS